MYNNNTNQSPSFYHSSVAGPSTPVRYTNPTSLRQSQSFSPGSSAQAAAAPRGPQPPPQQDPASYYGTFIDPTSARPTALFIRLSDALFFVLDAQCDVPGMRSTGHIEPAKYAWMHMRMNNNLEEAQRLQEYLPDLYRIAKIPVKQVSAPNGGTTSSLERRGFLHLNVFDAMVDPQEAFSSWTKILHLFSLIDPATSRPFPQPLPRSAFPPHANPYKTCLYDDWQAAVLRDVKRKRELAKAPQQQQQPLPRSPVSPAPAPTPVHSNPPTAMPMYNNPYPSPPLSPQPQPQPQPRTPYISTPPSPPAHVYTPAPPAHTYTPSPPPLMPMYTPAPAPAAPPPAPIYVNAQPFVYPGPVTTHQRQQSGSGSGSGGRGNEEHANTLDAIVAVASLTNTALSFFGGGNNN
ncbi:hypothetical protein BDW22DRAFT_1426169 [Trametopsis cervina]|nr:hypothetical protein BDW22DRAFT_1426169 [Trametopsis cervina]